MAARQICKTFCRTLFKIRGGVVLSPKSFNDCVKNGGKIKTKQLKGNKYIHICYDKNGNSYSGEIKVRKNDKKAKADKEQKQIEDSKKLAESLTELQKHFNNNYHT